MASGLVRWVRPQLHGRGATVPIICVVLFACSCGQRGRGTQAARFDDLFSPVEKVTVPGDTVAPIASEYACHVTRRRIFIWNYTVNSVAVYNRKGERIGLLGRHAGEGPGEFHMPFGVVADPDGNIYVIDRGNLRIQVFDAELRFLRSFRTATYLERIVFRPLPGGFSLLAQAVAPFPWDDGRQYLLREFGPDGEARAVLVPVDQPKVLYSWAVTCSHDGSIYVANSVEDVVSVVDSSGNPALSFRIQSPTVVPLHTKLDSEPTTIAELRAQQKTLNEERHTEIVALRVVRDFLLVQYRLREGSNLPVRYLMDILSRAGDLRFYGMECPGYMCSSQDTALVHFAQADHTDRTFGSLRIEGYRLAILR